MRKSWATSIVFGTLMLTGCAISNGKTDVNVENQAQMKEYSISQKFMMNQMEYKDLNQYKEHRQRIISEEIETFVAKEGFSEDGYNSKGFDRRGFNRNQVDEKGYAEDGYNFNNINEVGFDRKGKPSSFSEPYNKFGYDAKGYDINGLDKEGYDTAGYNQDGFNRLGESKNKDELSMNDYIKRNWSDISAKEIFEKDIYLPSVNRLMKENKVLSDQYYEQGMHPYSEQAYHLNLVCNNTPVIMDLLLPAIRIDAVSQLLIEKQQYHDEQIILKTATGELLQILNNEQFLPQRFESNWKALTNIEVGEFISLEDYDGFVNNYKVISKQALGDKEQTYIDFARLAMQDSKGKWAVASLDLDAYVYKALDQLDKGIALDDNILTELQATAKVQWPKNYLTDSSEEIEGFNDEMREIFIERIMLDIENYEQFQKLK